MSGSAAFLFPGQLAEWVGMGRDFFDADPEARRLFALTSERCGRDLQRLAFEGPVEELRENLAAQAGVYLVSTLAARELVREGVRPTATAGYSLGNYAAMVAAGAIDYEEALDVLVAVWRETERLQIRGAMAAVIGARRDAVEETLSILRSRGSLVWIGNVNASTQFVLTGSAEGVKAALEELRPSRPLGPSAHHELAHPQRAHAPGRRRDRAPDRPARDRAPPRRAVLRPRRRAGFRRQTTCGVCSARPSAFRLCGRKHSRRWSPTAIVSSWKPGRARCSPGWCAGSIGPPVVFRPARSPASGQPWI